jgi:competence ComEA-like helix-hairpin-helix protein
MSPTERRALLVVLALGVGGHLLRAARLVETPPPAVTALDSLPADDPLAHRDLSLALAAPLGADERIDADRSDAATLQRLPGVGPALARRIVADRESRGAFGGISGLDRVPGVGPAMLVRLAPHLSFSGRPTDPSGSVGTGPIALNRATASELDALPGVGVVRARAIVAFRDSAGPFRHVAELARVPGITVALATRIAPHVVVP